MEQHFRRIKVGFNDSYGVLGAKCSEEYKNLYPKDNCFICRIHVSDIEKTLTKQQFAKPKVIMTKLKNS